MFKVEQLSISIPELDVNSMSTLTIFINKTWHIEDFIDFFSAIDLLYKYHFWTYKAFLATKYFIENPYNQKMSYVDYHHTPLAGQLTPMLKKVNDLFDIYSRKSVFPASFHSTDLVSDTLLYVDSLSINKIRYSSPGFTDIAGISGILQHIKEILFYYFPNKNDKEKFEIIKQQRIELQIKNLKNIGLTDIQIKKLLLGEEANLETLSNFARLGMIEGVQLSETH